MGGTTQDDSCNPNDADPNSPFACPRATGGSR
jgi:hypothetical protein